MNLVLDHILWAAPDLDAGSALFERLTGVAPAIGGTHPGFATRNRLASLGDGTFFEVIAPDPAQTPRPDSRAAVIAALPAPALFTFAVQTLDMDAACRAAEAAGLGAARRHAMSRTRPDGVRLEWEVAHFSHPAYGQAVPFAIDWQGSPHPSGTSPGGCTLAAFAVLHPDPAPLAALYRAIELDIPVHGAARPGFVATLATPRGPVTLLG